MSFPIRAESPAAFTGPLPEAADVVVVGGGVIGVMTAWFLARRGVKVVVCEKGRIAGEQSSRNWGWVRQQGRDFAELPIMQESMRIWQGLTQMIGDGLGFRQEGVVYMARSQAEMQGFADWQARAAGEFGLDSRLLDRGQTDALLPGGASPWIGALYTPSDARAEPWQAVPLMARHAAEKGVVIREDCAVRALDRQGGRVRAVITERGRIGCDQVVVAGGAWSSLFLRSEGVSIPQLSVKATVARTAPMPQIFAGNACDDRFAFRRRLDGGYTIAAGALHDFFIGPDAFRHLRAFLPVLRKDAASTFFHPAAPRGYPDAWRTPRRWAADRESPFERMRILNPAPNPRILTQIQDDFARALPALGRPEIVDAWAGMIDTMPDVVPVVDRVETRPGLVIATGMSGHGFGIGPGIGRVVADLVAGRPLGHDIGRFRLARFHDGSRMIPGPSL